MLFVHYFVYLASVTFCHFFSYSWCQGLAAAYDCDTPWISLLFLVTWLAAAYDSDTPWISSLFW